MPYEVTIGIPVYRAADYIRQTMESALCQSFSSIEYLVLDDCCGDESMLIVEMFRQNHKRGSDIRIIRHDKHLGVGVARNRIISEASGRYLFFLDSDDILPFTAIEKLVSAIREFNAEVVYGSWRRVDKVNNSPSRDYLYPNIVFQSENSFAMYAFKNYSSFRISVCNCLIDLKFLRDNKMRFIDAAFWEDLAFTYEMVTKVNNAVLLSDITYLYLCRPGSLSHYQNRKVLYKNEILKNVQVINSLKEKCRDYVDKPYLSYLCYNLEMNSYYIVSHILKHQEHISPRFTHAEMQSILFYPMGFSDVVNFRHKTLLNLFFLTVAKLPPILALVCVKIVDIIKRLK